MPSPSPEPTTLRCPRCGVAHRAPPLSPGSVARCVRCGGELMRRPRLGTSGALAVSLGGLICWGFAAWFPLARVDKLGLSERIRLLEIGGSFRADGQPLLGLLVDLTVVGLPSLLFVLLPALGLATVLGRPGRGAWTRWLRAGDFARRWAMPEVFVLAILVAFTKIEELAQARLETGFWFLAAAVALLTIATQSFPALAYFRAIEASALPAAPPPSRRASQVRPWAYMIAAGLMLAPANLLPIMTVNEPGSRPVSQTILGGIAYLAGDGMWGIAAVVFVASILVPFTKLGGLAWLMLLARRRGGSRFAAQVYRFLDFIGRWSMLDIFLIGFLAGLIDFGALASVQAGPAAPAFAAAVVLTVIAVESFDTRSLWPNADPPIRS